MAWAAAAALLLLLAASEGIRADEEIGLDSVLVIGNEQGGSNRKLLQQMTGEPEPLLKWLVDKHNELRYRHGVQLLTWDWSLAWNAYNYITACPKGHSGQQGIGENLAWGHNDFNHAMRDWYDEIQFYNFNAPGFAENTGHFTQMVWRDAGKIGCAANLRCRFRTYICQFTPAGNLVNYDGSVGFQLWTTNVPAPSAQFVTGTKPDGSPSYMLYDPTGASTRGLQQPRYGELKNFGYVPKPGEVIVMTDWQKFIPTDIIQNYLPWVVLEQYLKPDILALLKPEPAAVPKPGQPIHKEPQRAVIGWQQFLPASVIKQYIPDQILAKYVPEGVVLATEKDQVGAYKSTNATATTNPAAKPTTAPTKGAPPKGPVSKPKEAPKEPPSFVAATAAAGASSIFAAPMKEPYEAGPKQRSPARQLMAADSSAEDQQGAVFFREEPAQLSAAQAHSSSTRTVLAASEAAAAVNTQQPRAAKAAAPRQQQEQGAKKPAVGATHAAVVKEQGALDSLLGGLGLVDRLRRDDYEGRRRDRTGLARDAPQQPLVPQQQPSYPVVQPTPVYPGTPAAGYSNPVGHVPAQQQQPASYYVQQPYPPQQQPQQQQPMTGAANQYGQLPQALPPQPPGYQQTAAVPLPTSQQQAGQAVQQAAGQVLPQGAAPQQQLPAGMQDVLDAHNFYRARHQAPAVVWDDQMAAAALGIASACPNGPSGTQGIGENLAWGFRDAGKGVDEWYKEGKQYDFNNPGFAMTSGHFSQVVWAETQRIGCALATTCSMPTLICHYFPPGNIMGADWSSQVRPPPPGVPAGPRPRQPDAAPALPPGYPYQTQRQPVAAVPYPAYLQQQQQQQQYQPVAAVPYPSYPAQQQLQQQPVPAVVAVPNPAYVPPQQQQQPVAAVEKPASQQQATSGHVVTYPTYETYQPYPTAAVPKPPHKQFVPVVGGAADPTPAGKAPRKVPQEAGPFSAPAIPAAAVVQAEGPEPTKPVTAATTKPKPFSAPALMTRLSDAVPKPATQQPGAVSSRGKLPSTSPVQQADGSTGQLVAAVDKPPFPVAAPRSYWPRVSTPVSSNGAPFSVSASIRPAAAAVLSPELQAALDRHNELRAAHQAPPLTWDDSIASSAQSWVAGCLDGHSGTRGVGENMAWGYPSLSAAVDGWYNEVKDYDFASPGWNTATGHFTALVWKSTAKLGCALNAACSWPTYVCQYGPPGNVIGLDWSEEVKPKSEAPVAPVDPSQPSIPTPTTAPEEPEPNTQLEPTPNPAPAPAQPKESAAQPTKPSPAPATTPAPKKQPPRKAAAKKGPKLTTEQQVALDKHNMYRSKHNTPALAWDTKLAAAAQTWADGCPWGLSDLPYGENMAFGYKSFGDVLDAWYSQLSDYDWGHPAYQPGTGHLSQLLWGGSSKLGCAVSKKCEWKTYVCMYDPPGNIDGDTWGANMLPPGGAKPQVAAVLKRGSGSDTVPAVAAVLKPEYQAALDRHNKHRQTHQAPALVWDDALAASAAKWAAGCPNGHSGYAGVGENMAWGYPSLSAAVDGWYNEVKDYDFASPGWNTATGHFTALVWKSTTKLGCTTNTACGWATYVCQYQTPGNIIGLDWSQYVKPALSAAAPGTSPAPKAPAASRAPAKSPAPLLKSSPAPTPIKASPSPPPATKASPVLVPVAPKTSDMRKVLEMHNAYRRTHQAPALVWDEKLAASAQKWADTCTFGVSRMPGVGEALGFGYRTFPDAVKGWYNQVSKYDFSRPGWKSGSGLFTQMVWRSSKGVGCAVNTACTWATYVCHYSPPGNRLGPGVDWSQEVKPALTTAAVPKPGGQASAVGPDDSAPVVEDQAWDAQTRQPGGAQAAVAVAAAATGQAGVPASVPTAAAVGFPDSSSTNPSIEPANPDLAEALRRSNMYRKRHQVAPLSWDASLASQAAAFLADCPLKHSTIRNVGESLGWGFHSFTDVVDAWYSEVNSYSFNKPGWAILAGHFSQMVWKDTTRIGCAVNKACTWDTYICQYSPPGNAVTADWSTQVFPALPEKPEETQHFSNPTLLPGEAYYNPHRGSDSSSTVQQFAPSVSLDQLAQRQAGSTPAAPVTPTTPAAGGSQDPPEIPVTPSAPSEVTPSQRSVTPAPAPQQPAGVPTMPADQLFPQAGSSSSSDSSSSQAAGSGAAAAPTSSTAGSSDSTGSAAVPGLSAELQAGLDMSNSYRRQHNSPDLAWDASIASQAAAFVAGCPTGHSNVRGFGENLAWGYDSLSAVVTAWYDEVSLYDFNKGGFSGATGHFTALVWKDTTKVGCAVNRACSMPTYVCQYSPQGNVMGVDWSKQVQRKGASAATPAAQPTPATPSTPLQPVGQQPQQQQQQQQPVQPSQPPANWWDQPQQQQQQSPMEPTAPTPLKPTPAQPATPAAPPAAAAADGSAPAAYSVVFAATNAYRAKHQVPALTWDAALAARSQAYADSCPGGHSGDKGVGENLAWGYPFWQSAVDAWYNEVQTYSFSNPGWSGATGHFTQLVWKDTTRVGCGYNSRCAMETYVCQYSPAGNVLGDGWSKQVLPATS